MFEMADTNLKITCSVLLPVATSGLGTPIICFWEVLDLLEVKSQENNFIMSYYVFATNIKTKE